MRAKIYREILESEDLQLHASLSDQVHRAAAKRIAAQRILKKVYFHPGPSALRQRFGKCIRYLAFFPEEVLECDRPLRGTDRLEQSWKDLVTIFQRCHFVAFEQGRAEHISHHPGKDIVPDCVVSDDFVMNFLLGGEEIAGNKKCSRSANGGRAEQCRPFRWARARRSRHSRISHSVLEWEAKSEALRAKALTRQTSNAQRSTSNAQWQNDLPSLLASSFAEATARQADH